MYSAGWDRVTGAPVLRSGEVTEVLEECWNKIFKIIMCSPVDLSFSVLLLFIFLHLKPGVVMSCTKQCLLVQRRFSGLRVYTCVCVCVCVSLELDSL